MIQDPVTLDQLRTFATVAAEGNFTAAARKLRRVQSAVSTSMANLELQLGVKLWDRSTKIAALTEHGRAVLTAARRVLAEMDSLRGLAAGLEGGVEPRVSLCVDALFPLSALVDAAADFARQYPMVDLRVDVETLSAVSDRIVDRSATLGVVSPMGLRPELERVVLASIQMIAVVGPSHPLAKEHDRVPTATLADHVQLVLSGRNTDKVPDQAVLSPRTWRVADLATKHAMLRGGLGWGNLPEHLARGDLERGALVRIRPQAWADDEHTLHLSAIHRRDEPLGPAHRWLLGALERLCARDVAPLGKPPERGHLRPKR